MITALDSRVMDINSEHLGVSVQTLMGNAGKAIADYINSNFQEKRIAVFCGHGNNGGDGFAAAPHIRGHVQLFCITDTGKIRSTVVREYMSTCGTMLKPMAECMFDFDVLLDCGLGTGLKGSLRPEYAEYVALCRSFKGTIVSVDVPTGFGTDECIKPDYTITMHEIKEGMSEENCGKIYVADIGMPEAAYRETGPGDMLRYPVPKTDSHKGTNGSLLVIGGGPYYGAPAMSGLAALRVGTDLVTIAAPESVFLPIASYSPVLMIHKLSGDHLIKKHIPDLLTIAEKMDAVLIGPGLGKDPETVEAVKLFLSKCTKPTVIDADGLGAIGDTFHTDNKETILTPHAKEFERLGGKEKNESGVNELSRSTGAVVLLKGKTDIICGNMACKLNRTGCAGMTGAGTGDVLSGLIAGLLAKGMKAFDAASLGAYLSGKAGEKAFETKSYGMIATDVVDIVPIILNEHLTGRKP